MYIVLETVSGVYKCTCIPHFVFLQAKYCQNALRMRELWNDIMSMGYASQAQMWLQYVHLERSVPLVSCNWVLS